MSRSYRKTSIIGVAACASEKRDKRLWHKSFRSKNKQKVRAEREDFDPIHIKEVSNPWAMSKDGKHFFDKKKHFKDMRK